MVVKKYGSMVNTLGNTSFGGTPVGTPVNLQLDRRDQSLQEVDMTQ